MKVASPDAPPARAPQHPDQAAQDSPCASRPEGPAKEREPASSAAPSGRSRAHTRSGRAALGYRDFRLSLGARFTATLALHMQTVAIGWQVYAITGRALDLAWVGLAQFVPAAGLTLVSGQVADRVDRRRILVCCEVLQTVCALLLWAHARSGSHSVHPVYAVLVLVGVARAFQGPASQAYLPQLVPAHHFENAVAWSGSVWQMATIAGPAVGGALYAATSATGVYAGCVMLLVIATAFTVAIDTRSGGLERRPLSVNSVLAGFRYIWRSKLVLGCTSLDLFAVLLGGATALLPIYARDILHAGPVGLGLLRSAPALGAASTGLALAYHPIERHVGRRMLVAVAIFGLGTLVFAVSTRIELSLIALVTIGAADMVSVVIRGTLVQLATPGEMRGRVSAVNALFIGASNELGEFESGATAALLGAVPAAVLGGLGTCVVVVLWAWLFPTLRKADRPAEVHVHAA